MRDLRKSLNSDTVTVRAFLLRHVQRIVMQPDGRRYIASGNWDYLGDACGWCRGRGTLHIAYGFSRGFRRVRRYLQASRVRETRYAPPCLAFFHVSEAVKKLTAFTWASTHLC
jgi:hypothetical protein